MVLNKNIFFFYLFSLLIFFPNIKAESKKEPMTIQRLISEMQMALDKNQEEKVEDLFDENEKLISKSREALERLAISFERRSKFIEAAKIYKKLISLFYEKEHNYLMKNKDSNNFNSAEIQKTQLPYYYYKLAFLFVQQYRTTHEFTNPSEKAKLYQIATISIVIAEKASKNPSEIKLLKELLLEKENEEINMQYVESWYGLMGISSWQDYVYLKNSTLYTRSKLITTNIGLCLGGGKKWENIKYEFNLDGCYFQGTSTVSEVDTNIQFSQSKVPVKAVFMGPGLYVKSFSEYIKIGLQVPIFYRNGNWALPKGNYTFENQSLIGGGPMIQIKVKAKKINILTRIGKMFPNPSILWSTGLTYDF
jgi:hypothetical protein